MGRVHGMTLLELLCVVAIVAILATIAVPNFLKTVEKARVKDVQVNLNILFRAEQMYKLDNATYGTLNDLVTKKYLPSPVSVGFTYATRAVSATGYVAYGSRSGGAYSGKTVGVDQNWTGLAQSSTPYGGKIYRSENNAGTNGHALRD